jgi:hypothetical protein
MRAESRLTDLLFERVERRGPNAVRLYRLPMASNIGPVGISDTGLSLRARRLAARSRDSTALLTC